MVITNIDEDEIFAQLRESNRSGNNGVRCLVAL